MKMISIILGASLLFSGCDQITETDSKTGFSKGFKTVQKKSNSYLNRGVDLKATHRSAQQVVRIRKRHSGVINGLKTVTLEVDVPYNLRGDGLKDYLKGRAVQEIKGSDAIILRAYHMGVSSFSGEVAFYQYFNGGKKSAVLKEYLSKEVLLQRGHDHYLLELDYQVLTMIEEVLKQFPNISREELIQEVAKKKRVSTGYLEKLLIFGASYYQSSILKNLN